MRTPSYISFGYSLKSSERGVRHWSLPTYTGSFSLSPAGFRTSLPASSGSFTHAWMRRMWSSTLSSDSGAYRVCGYFFIAYAAADSV